MKIEIVEEQIEDIEAVQEVFYRTWLTTYPNVEHGITLDDIEDRYKDRQSEETLAKRRAEFLVRGGQEKLFVAKDAGMVVGVCRVMREENKNQLQAIYVLPEYQGNGVGLQLWAAAREFLDSKKDTLVSVATYNQKSINFYVRLGFVDTGKRFTEERLRLKSGVSIPELEMKLQAT